MKVIGIKIISMVKENIFIKMVIFLKVNTKIIIRVMEMLFIYLKMVQNMKDNLRMVKNMEKEN